eukprot:7451575-Pyramimonas_sp.AAC.1
MNTDAVRTGLYTLSFNAGVAEWVPGANSGVIKQASGIARTARPRGRRQHGASRGDACKSREQSRSQQPYSQLRAQRAQPSAGYSHSARKDSGHNG